MRAILLSIRLALSAGVIRTDEAPNTDRVAYFNLGNLRANRRHPADDLVAGHAGVYRGHDLIPLISSGMEIGVAYAAEQNLDLHVPFGGLAASDRSRFEWRGFAIDCIGLGLVHLFLHLLMLLTGLDFLYQGI